MKFEPKGPARYEHQREGLRKLLKQRGVGALLFDPGLGKTATALDFCSIIALKHPRREARVLVISPLAAIDTWVDQCEQYVHDDVAVWAEALGGSIQQKVEALAARGGQPYRQRAGARRPKGAPRALHVGRSVALYTRSSSGGRVPPLNGPDALGQGKPRLILESLNFDTFKSRQSKGSRTMADLVLDGVARFKPDLVIVDEMHKLKGSTSNVSRLLSRVGDRVPMRMGLTGTIMPHSPLDVFAQWRFLDPYAFGDLDSDGDRMRATYSGFVSRYAVLGGYMGQEPVGFKNLDEMQEIMSQIAVVAKKEDALDLPALTQRIVPVHLTPKEQRAYDDLKGGLVAQLSSGVATAGNKLTQMLRLRQITAGHLPDDNGMLHDLGNSKARVISSIAHDMLPSEKRLVVFAVFKHEVAALQKSLAQRGTEVLMIDGHTPSDERRAIRKRFGSDEPGRLILVAQIKTISLAVNELVTASNVIFATLSQQRDDLIQGIDRINRIGQTKPMTVWYALAPGTVDEVVLKSHAQRTNLEQAMLKHVRDLGSGTASLLSEAELAALAQTSDPDLAQTPANDALSIFK